MVQKNIKNEKIKTAWLSLSAGIILFAIKVTAYIITDSSAIFSDAAESIINIFAAGAVLYSIILSAKPPDKSHPYGHGKVEYFSAGFEGLLILLAAITIIYASIDRMISGAIPTKLDIGIVLILFASIFNLILGNYLIRKGKQTDSIALVADGKHILTDSITSFGIVVGLIIVLFTDIYILDPLIAIVVAFNILFTGTKLVRQSVGGLMNEIDPETLNRIIIRLLEIRDDRWIDLHQLRYWKSANATYIDFHLTLPFFLTIKEAHQIEALVLQNMNDILPGSQVKIHFDYCKFDLCNFCKYDKCNERKETFSQETIWDEEKVTGKAIND